MSKEIIINAKKEQTRIAIVKDGALSELYFEDPENTRTLGDIYLGCVRSLRPSIEAAFIDIGQKQDAFLHYSDLTENLEALLAFVSEETPVVPQFYPPWAERNGGTEALSRSDQRQSGGRGKASPNLLTRGQRILVRIVKEPISTKGSRVSSAISLAGRFLVLVPLVDCTAVSKKIFSAKERRRLRELARMLKPQGFGVIVRTVAEGKDAKSIDTDMQLLLDKWGKIERRLAGLPNGPLKVHGDVSMASSVVRDLFSDDYDRILVDQPRVHRNIRSYVQAVAPQMASVVQLHRGQKPIFEACNLDRDINEVFESHVDLPSGGYIIVERTEAMHVVDVNSGRSGRGLNQEDSALKVNLEAAKVLARQIRLRDLGGIIVVDFIDLGNEGNRKKLLNELISHFKDDRAATRILPMSDFGLIQITRQRLRPSLTSSYEGPGDSPVVQGSETLREGAVTELLLDIEDRLAGYASRQGRKPGVRLIVHPFTAAYLKTGFPARPTRWRMKYRIRVQLESDPSMDFIAFRCREVGSDRDVPQVSEPAEADPPEKRIETPKVEQHARHQQRSPARNVPKSQGNIAAGRSKRGSRRSGYRPKGSQRSKLSAAQGHSQKPVAEPEVKGPRGTAT